MTRVILVNAYGDEVAELKQENGYWIIPEKILLDIGDKLEVKEVWSEEV